MKDTRFETTGKEKKAILMLHFGSTYADTREKTIDVLDAKVKNEYSDFELRRAFTSRIIMKKLKERDGIVVDNPTEALGKLANEGYTHIVIQASHIINGLESETLRREVELNFSDKFEVIKYGAPLLSSVEDYKLVAKGLYGEFAPKDDEALVLIGHGTHHHGNAAYGMLDSLFKYEGMGNVFVSTVEGYPELDNVINMLNKEKYKKVILAPLMFVAGDHAKNDIGGDIKEELEDKGFEIKVILKGLGESEVIQNIFKKHIDDAINIIPEDMLKKKKEYSK